MTATHKKPTNSMNIHGTFEVFNIKTGRWHGTFTEFKTAEATADLLNARASGEPRYTWWWVR